MAFQLPANLPHGQRPHGRHVTVVQEFQYCAGAIDADGTLDCTKKTCTVKQASRRAQGGRLLRHYQQVPGGGSIRLQTPAHGNCQTIWAYVTRIGGSSWGRFIAITAEYSACKVPQAKIQRQSPTNSPLSWRPNFRLYRRGRSTAHDRVS